MKINNTYSFLSLLILLTLIQVKSFAQGNGTSWRVDEIKFASGEIANGNFTYNPNNNTYSNINVQVTRPNNGTLTFQNVEPGGVATRDMVSLVATNGTETIARLRLSLSIRMTNDGGPIEIVADSSSFELCTNGTCGPTISRPSYGFIVAPRAQAGTRTWYLDNVRFESGAIATGSFDYNSEPHNPLGGQYGTFSRINIDVTSPDGTVRKFRIVNPNSRGNARYISIVAAEGGDLAGAPFMALTPQFAMTNEGSVIDILPGPQDLSYIGVCRQSNCGPADAPYEEALAGGRIISGPRMWYLDNVQFESGAKASGYFEYDLEPYNPLGGQYGTYRNIYIDVTNPNGSIRKFRAVNPASRGNARYVSVVAFPDDLLTEDSEGYVTSLNDDDLTGLPFMALTTAHSLPAAGGVVDILPGAQGLSYIGVCRQANCGPADAPYEEAMTGGKLISNPGAQRWYLEGVQFDSGAKASGSFDYNPIPLAPLGGAYGLYSNININVSLNGDIRNFTIVNPNSKGNARYVSIVALSDSQKQDLNDLIANDTIPQDNSPNDILQYISQLDLTGRPFMALTPERKINDFDTLIPILPGPHNLSYIGNCGQANCGPAYAPYEEALSGGRIVKRLARPIIVSSNSISVAENQTTVIDVNATDNIDTEGNGLVYSISGGQDAVLFSLDINTGVISFINAPDYETPGDANVDNIYEIQVTVTDLGGLAAVQDIAVTVTDKDEIPPVANPVFDPQPTAAGWFNDDVTVTWNWTDEPGGSGLDPENCDHSYTFAGEGSFAAVGQCLDLAGNLGLQGSGSIDIDRTAPETEFSSTPSSNSYTGEYSMSFTGSDALSGVAGFECIIDNGSFAQSFPCTSPVQNQILEDGVYTISVVAIDHAGNIDPTPASFTLTVDSCPSVFTLSSPTDDFLVGTHVRQADQSITASNKVLGTTDLVSYRAGTEITMEAGFEIEAGAEFHAFIEGCSSSVQTRL